MKGKGFTSYMINTLLTIALCMAYCFAEGILGFAAGLFVTALLALVLKHDHYLLGISNTVLVGVILVLNLGVWQGIISGVSTVLLALILAMGTQRKTNVYSLLLKCSTVITAEFMANLAYLERATQGKVTVSGLMLDMGRQMRETLASSDPAAQNMVDKLVSQTVDASIMMAPSMFLIISVVCAYLLILLYKSFEKRRKTDMSFLLPFGAMRGDKTFGIVYLVLVVLLLVLPESMVSDALLNVVVFLSFLFVALGISFLNGKLQGKRMGGKIVLLVILCITSAFVVLPLSALLICGVLDCFFDYRGLDKTSEN